MTSELQKISFSFDNVVRSLMEQAEAFMAHLPTVFVGLVVFAVFVVVAKLVRKTVRLGFERANRAGSGALVVARLAYLAVITLGTLVSLSIFVPGFEFGTLVGTLGLSSVAIGFAFKEILENFFAGLYILISRPFEVGDVIRIGTTTGRVVDIGTRAAILVEFDREVTVMPCSRLFKEQVTVISKEKVRRIEVSSTVPYGTDLEALKETVEGATISANGVEMIPEPSVAFRAVQPGSVDFSVQFFSDLNKHDSRDVESDVLLAIDRALVKAGVRGAEV